MMVGTRMMMWLLRIALLCGSGPLIVGVGTVVVYYFVDAGLLESVGLWTIVVGVWLAPVGLVSLIVYWILGRMGKGDITRASWIALLILILNFPAALVCFASAGRISDSRYHVVVENRSGETFSDVRLDVAGKDKRMRDVPSEGDADTWFYVRREGQLALRGRLGNEMIDQVIDETLVRNQGERIIVTISPDGDLSVGEPLGSWD
jgi:hypothetical protein